MMTRSDLEWGHIYSLLGYNFQQNLKFSKADPEADTPKLNSFGISSGSSLMIQGRWKYLIPPDNVKISESKKGKATILKVGESLNIDVCNDYVGERISEDLNDILGDCKERMVKLVVKERKLPYCGKYDETPGDKT